MIDTEDVFVRLENIFWETVADNLNAHSLALIDQHRQALVIQLHEGIDDSWFDLMADELTEGQWLEADISLDYGQVGQGAEGKRGEKRLALFLINSELDDEDERQCHIQWFDLS